MDETYVGGKPRVPPLRFPDFSEPWVEKRLGDVAEIIGGGTPDTHNPDYWNGEIQWFTPTEIKTKYLTTSTRTITEKGVKESSAKLLPTGALLLSTRATVGDIGIATQPCTTNQGFQSLIVKETESNEFWFYWIEQNKDEFIRRANGSTFLEISKNSIAEIPAISPHPDEQRKIADFLGAVDRWVAALRARCDALATYKSGVMQQIFSQKIRFTQPDGTPFPDWQEKRLGDVATRITRRNDGLTNTRVLTNSATQGIVDQGDFFDRDIANAENIAGYYVAQKGDFIYNPRISAKAPVGPINRNNLGVGIFSPLYTVFRFNTKKTEFFNQYFKSTAWHPYILTVANYGARHDRISISMSDFVAMPMPAPHPDEQQKIADFLGTIDHCIDAATRQITTATTFKRGLLQQMFI